MQRLPVIGHSLSHSPFETVQRAAIEASAAPLQVEPWDRKPHQLADAIAKLRADDVAGGLIANPHKEKAAGLVDHLSDDARQSGAVNVIVREGAKLRGYNTDVDGLRAGLEALLPKVRAQWPRQAVILGAGGGARAAVTVLIAAGMHRIAVFNRHLHRAEALVAHFGKLAKQIDLRAMPWHDSILETELAKSGLLVNGSGIGLEEGASPFPGELLPHSLHVLDLVLQHAITPLMRDVADRDGTAVNGQLAFLASSAATFRLLTGADAPAGVMKSALAAELGLPDEGGALVGD